MSAAKDAGDGKDMEKNAGCIGKGRENAPGETLKKALSKPSSKNYPRDDPKTFKAIFDGICQTYELNNPVDQMIANRAATQLMTLQFCQDKLKEYGIFFEVGGDEGKRELKMNQLAYYMKQVESEFRANIRMLRQKPGGLPDTDSPKDFSQWLEEAGKRK